MQCGITLGSLCSIVPSLRGMKWLSFSPCQFPSADRAGLTSQGRGTRATHFQVWPLQYRGKHLALVGAGNCVCSWALLLCPAWLGTGSSWQSSVMQTQSFSCQLLRVVPGGSCYFCIETRFSLIISVLHLENQI